MYCIRGRLKLFEAGRSRLQHETLSPGPSDRFRGIGAFPGIRLLSPLGKRNERKAKLNFMPYLGQNGVVGGFLSKERMVGKGGVVDSQHGNLHGRTATLPRLGREPHRENPSIRQPYDPHTHVMKLAIWGNVTFWE